MIVWIYRGDRSGCPRVRTVSEVAEQTTHKPRFTRAHLITSSFAARHFGEIREHTRTEPLEIMDNGRLDTVVLGCAQYEQAVGRLLELEEMHEALVLEERIQRLQQSPSVAAPWRQVRRSSPND